MELHFNDRELNVEEIIKDAWQIIKEYFPVLLPAIALYVILGLTVDTFWHVLFRYNRKGHLLGNYLLKTTNSVLRDFIIISIILITNTAIKGETVTFKETMKKTFGLWPSSIWADFLSLIMIIGLTLLFVIPGIIWAVYLTFVTYAVVLQSKKGKTALNYSKSIVKGYWWKIFFIIGVFGVLGIAPYTYITIFYELFHKELSLSSAIGKLPLELILVSSLFSSFIFCFFVIANVILFRNLEYLKNVPEPVEQPVNPLDPCL